MRVVLTCPLLSVLTGEDTSIQIRCRLEAETIAEIEQALQEMPDTIRREFNESYATHDEVIEHVSSARGFNASEFGFAVETTRLGKLARECLIYLVPLWAERWSVRHVPIAELYIGGSGEPLKRSERNRLMEAMHDVWALPIKGKVFVLGGDVTGPSRGAARMGLRELGAVLEEGVSPRCDYFVTDTEDLARSARDAGARKIIDTLVMKVMRWDRA